MTKIIAILLVIGVLVGAAVGSYFGTWLASKSLRPANQIAPLNQQPMQLPPQQPMAPGQGNQLPQQQQPNQNQSAPNQPAVNQPMPN